MTTKHTLATSIFGSFAIGLIVATYVLLAVKFGAGEFIKAWSSAAITETEAAEALDLGTLTGGNTEETIDLGTITGVNTEEIAALLEQYGIK